MTFLGNYSRQLQPYKLSMPFKFNWAFQHNNEFNPLKLIEQQHKPTHRARPLPNCGIHYPIRMLRQIQLIAITFAAAPNDLAASGTE
jgi:hypothetical protein